jgi:hypothetical protein
MARRTSSTRSTWTAQQRALVAAALFLCAVGLTICVVRLDSGAPPSGGNPDSVGAVG